MKPVIVCSPKQLPRAQWVRASERAIAINPMNNAQVHRLSQLAGDGVLHGEALRIVTGREALAVVTTRYWHSGGVHLTVGFLDSPPVGLRRKILSHMNAWSKTANVRFVETRSSAQVRIARTPGDGYWSYLGTEILEIPAGQATMNLDSFTEDTPDSEFHRVVRHETGHTMGFPHEHMRKALVALIDKDKAIAYFKATQGWNEQMVVQQVLTPIEDSSILGTPKPDPNSIMCYQIPGSITKSGAAIPGGKDIDKLDFSFVATIYPKGKARTSGARGSRGSRKTVSRVPARRTAGRRTAKRRRTR
jgi:Astacin (Peptidase family M12A).